jgi:hypothetical protein
MLFGVILQGLSWLLIAIGALGFFFADRALREFVHMSWGLAEVIGTGGAVVCLVAGFGLKALTDS